MYACNAPFASAISVDWSFDWWTAYRFFAFQVQLISHPMMLTRRKKDLLLIEALSASVTKRLRGHSKRWDKPPPTAGAERSVTRPLVACWRGRNGVLELLAVVGDGGQPQKKWSNWKQRREHLSVCHFEVSFLSFLWNNISGNLPYLWSLMSLSCPRSSWFSRS